MAGPPQLAVEVVERVDPARGERVHELVSATGPVAQVLEEEERRPVVVAGVLELAPGVELRIRRAEEAVLEAEEEPVRALAQLRVALVEPHGVASSPPELLHVAELVRQDRLEVVGAHPHRQQVHVDHLALGRELVHPARQPVGGAEVPGGGTRDPRHEDVDAGIRVDPRRPLLAEQAAVGRVDPLLEGLHAPVEVGLVHLGAGLHPPLRAFGEAAERRRDEHVPLRREVVDPEIRDRADVLVRRRGAHRLELARGRAVLALDAADQVEAVRDGDLLRAEGGGHVGDRDTGRGRGGGRLRGARRGRRRRRGDRRDARAPDEQERDRQRQATRKPHVRTRPSAIVRVATSRPSRK